MADETRARGHEPGLRERKKRQMREEISAVATRMFIERGFEQVTIVQVAEAANVAKMTVTNYFPLKEDLVFDRHDEVVAALTGVVVARGPGESVLDAARRYYREALRREDPTLGQRGVEFARMVEASPALVARERQMHDQRELALAEVLVDELAASPEDLRPRIVAAQIVGVVRVLYYEARRRLRAGANLGALAGIADAAFDLLRTDIGDYGVRTGSPGPGTP